MTWSRHTSRAVELPHSLENSEFFADMKRQLTRQQREIVVRRRLGFTVSEIADAMQLSPSTVLRERQTAREIFRKS